MNSLTTTFKNKIKNKKVWMGMNFHNVDDLS